MSPRIAFLFSLVLLTAFESHAASIAQTTSAQGTKFIEITGELVLGDEKTFNNIAVSLDDAIVLLNSPGGKEYVGIQIGKTIAIKGFKTAVPPSTMCASACGLIWLAGHTRAVFDTSRLGFHAMYTNPTGKADVSSSGNALVGSYLHQLGFNESVVIYVTDAQPDSMQWLTEADAKSIGLEAMFFKAEEPQPKPVTGWPGAAISSNIQQPPPQVQMNVASASPIIPAPAYAPTVAPSQNYSPPPYWTRLDHTDLMGFDLPGMPMTASTEGECKSLCDGYSQCRAFTLNIKSKACFLKSSAHDAFQFTGAVSGYKDSQLQIARVGSDYGDAINFRSGNGREIVGNTIRTVASANAGWCQDQCVTDALCKGFNYLPNGTCQLYPNRKPTKVSPGTIYGAKFD